MDMNLRDQYATAKKNLVERIKQETGYKENKSFFSNPAIISVLILVLFLVVISAKGNLLLQILCGAAALILALIFVYINMQEDKDPAYEIMRNKVAEIERLIDNKKPLSEEQEEIYNKYKDYFELYAVYIKKVRGEV